MRYSTTQSFTTVGVTSWTAPAGVTSVMVIPYRTPGSNVLGIGSATVIQVTPGASYSVTIPAYDSKQPSTIGSIYSSMAGNGTASGIYGGVGFYLMWMDG